MAITDKAMHATPSSRDQWLTEDAPRGAGRFLGRITPSGERSFYFRHTLSNGERDTLPIGNYDPKGRAGMTLAEARAKANEWRAIYVAGNKDLRSHFAELEANKLAQLAAAETEAKRLEAAAAEADRRSAFEIRRQLTVRQLFIRWQETDLQPLTLKNGERQGRKDGGALIEQQFAKHLFPELGDKVAEQVRRADVMTVLDKIKAKGLSRTANMVLSSLRQMFTFAIVREIVTVDPTHGISKKRDGGGKDVERDRFLTAEEIKLLAAQLPTARLNKRTEAAIWLMLATGCRIGELMGAVWSNAGKSLETLTAAAETVNAKVGFVDLKAKTWLIFDTKNQQDHLVQLSDFACAQFEMLAELRELGSDGQPTPWLFPSSNGTGPVGTKSVNKQLQDRQRSAGKRMANRAKSTEALMLPGGPWTPHDLRRTAATLMSKAGVNTTVIHMCLNHKPQDKLDRIYIQDDHLDARLQAFTALGARLKGIVDAANDSGVACVGR